MGKNGRRLCALLITGWLLWGSMPFPGLAQQPAAACPPLTDAGFLLEDSPLSEFVHANVQAGYWQYISQDLHVQIWRQQGKVEGRHTVWFVSDIRTRDRMPLRSFQDSPDTPGKGKARPEYIAQKNRVVYAQNGDLWTWRLEHKRYTGVIIREGQIIQEKTYRKLINAQPPLDELSLYQDGRIEVHPPGELSGEAYLQRGAWDVFSFGPALIQDGLVDPRLSTQFTAAQPRSAIGMVAPGHYVGVMVEGRTKRSSHGASLQFVAQVLLERGCTLAFNLDGGQTAAMVFMGSLVMQEPTYNGYTTPAASRTSSALAFPNM